MNLIRILIVLLAMADLKTQWSSLVDAEKTFAKTSVAKGTKDAFLSALDDQSVIFRPRAVPGRKWFQENPAPPAQLSWEPEYADIAAAGDLGYTTGPWEVRRTPQDQPAGFGHYVTLWRKPAGGDWKIAIDIGISHDRVAKPSTVDSPELPKDVAAARPKTDIDAARTAIAAADKAAMSELPKYLAPDVRLYREGSLPFTGKAAAEKRLAESRDSLVGAQTAAMVSSSADLGYTYGTTDSANYLRIWKKQRDGSWKIVLDLLNPFPKGAE